MKRIPHLWISGALLMACLLAAPCQAADAIDAVKGHYFRGYSRFMPRNNEYNHHKESLIIIKLSPTTAYFYTELAYCSPLSGIADLQADGSLLYQEDQPDEGFEEKMDDGTIKQVASPKAHYWCVLGIHPTQDGVVFSDREDERDNKERFLPRGVCNLRYSGSSSGVFEGAGFTNSERRPVSPARKRAIEKSEEYQQALQRRAEFLKAQQQPESAAPIPITPLPSK